MRAGFCTLLRNLGGGIYPGLVKKRMMDSGKNNLVNGTEPRPETISSLQTRGMRWRNDCSSRSSRSLRGAKSVSEASEGETRYGAIQKRMASPRPCQPRSALRCPGCDVPG